MVKDRNDGMDDAGERYLISDREVDRLAEAELAFGRWEQTRRWWLVGCIDDRDAGESEVA